MFKFSLVIILELSITGGLVVYDVEGLGDAEDDEELASDDEELVAEDEVLSAEDEELASVELVDSAGALNCCAMLAETLELAARIAFELFKSLTLIKRVDPGVDELFEAVESVDELMKKPPLGKNGLMKFQKIASTPFN